jgi:hypothetical protein
MHVREQRLSEERTVASLYSPEARRNPRREVQLRSRDFVPNPERTTRQMVVSAAHLPDSPTTELSTWDQRTHVAAMHLACSGL